MSRSSYLTDPTVRLQWLIDHHDVHKMSRSSYLTDPTVRLQWLIYHHDVHKMSRSSYLTDTTVLPDWHYSLTTSSGLPHTRGGHVVLSQHPGCIVLYTKVISCGNALFHNFQHFVHVYITQGQVRTISSLQYMYSQLMIIKLSSPPPLSLSLSVSISVSFLHS